MTEGTPNRNVSLAFYVRAITKGGVGTFIRKVLENMPNSGQTSALSVVCDASFNDRLSSYYQIEKGNVRSRFLFDWIIGKRLLIRLNPDVVVYPKNTIPITHIGSKWKKIVIVHDLGYFERKIHAYPFLDTLYMKVSIPRSCRAADAVLAVSEFTKRDIVQRFSVDERKVSVIGEGATELSSGIGHNQSCAAPYFMYAGSLSPRKNLQRVFEAFRRAAQTLPHHLYITGLKSWGDNEFLKHYSDLSDRIHILGYVPEHQLASLYRGATALLYPSLYEGFGLPILEAQALDCPVITSNATACPETAGDAAYLVDPYSIDEIYEAILTIAQDKLLRKELVSKGRQNITRFSWFKSAQRLLDTAEAIL